MEWQALLKPEGLAWRYPERFARFLAKVEVQENGCWYWIASLNEDGYGRFEFAEEEESLAHRAAYLLFNGRFDEEVVRHGCHVPRCVNPLHLAVGTHADNCQDMLLAGRQGDRVKQGEQHARAILRDEDVRRIKGIFIAEPWRSLTDIASEFGSFPQQIWRIKNGLSWTHITDHILPDPRPAMRRRV